MRVQVLTAGAVGETGPRSHHGEWEDDPGCWGTWRPERRLGAGSRGGLMLPDATPSAATLYAPRGVCIDGERLVVCDTGNHRVLIWHRWPGDDGADADVVLGQRDFESEGPAAGRAGPAAGMHLPTGVLIDEGSLVVADGWHHRILVWDELPQENGAPPDHVIGQDTARCVEPNRGGEPDAGSFYWPFGIALVDGRFYVADTGNRRVLCWPGGLPRDGRPAEIVIGQTSAHGRDENRGGEADGHSFRWPHAVAGTGDGGIFVADAGNHRLLRWHAHPPADGPADTVIGQPDFASVSEFPYQSQAGRLRFPYGVAAADGLALADTANNRVLVWETPPRGGDEPPDAALGQGDFAGAGENRWESVSDNTLCWPYGLSWHGDRIAVADSGNNRVTVWSRAGVA